MRSLGRNLPIRFAEWIWYKWNKWWLTAATLWKCDFSRCFCTLCKDFTGWQHCQEAAHRPPAGETLGSSGYILARCKEHCLELHQAALYRKSSAGHAPQWGINRGLPEKVRLPVHFHIAHQSPLHAPLHGLHGGLHGQESWGWGVGQKLIGTPYCKADLNGLPSAFLSSFPNPAFPGRQRKIHEGLRYLSCISLALTTSD